MTRALLITCGALLLVSAVIWLAQTEHGAPARCSPGFFAGGARCCAEGQIYSAQRCSGNIVPCQESNVTPPCQITSRRITIAAMTLNLRFNDWQTSGNLPTETLTTRGFEIDNTEVTQDQFAECVRALSCSHPRVTTHDGEKTRPQTHVPSDAAEKYCDWKGGRLPTRAEWTIAAAGRKAHKYPWGHTGLVCRRAVYGLTEGPCAHAALGPDSAGSKPAGATPTGILDMAGNVAEWVKNGTEYGAMGGSYKSRLASEVKVWAFQQPKTDLSHVGFRCVYPKYE